MIFLTIDLVHILLKPPSQAKKSSKEMERRDDYRWTDSESEKSDHVTNITWPFIPTASKVEAFHFRPPSRVVTDM